jgi:hypothetical protein
MIGYVAILVAALAAGQAAKPAESAPRTTTNALPLGTLNIPSDISPAIWPYYDCLIDSRGIERRRSDGTAERPVVAAGADCVAQRGEAMERADRILRNRSMGTTSRRAEYIETVLARVDGFVAGLGGSYRPAASGPQLPGKPADPLPSIDVPYQILPAYQVYTSCVGDHFISDPRSRAADDSVVRQANSDAVAACRQVREAQLARALDLLTDYRLYAGNRETGRQAVRTAFDRFDRDYLIEPAATGPVAPMGVVRHPAMLALPNEVAPALMPYVQCMFSDSQERLMGVSTGEAARAAVARLLGDCRGVRDTAEQRSRERLERSDVSESDRERIISEALVSVDHMRDDVAEHLDQVNARRERLEGQHDASNR